MTDFRTLGLRGLRGGFKEKLHGGGFREASKEGNKGP